MNRPGFVLIAALWLTLTLSVLLADTALRLRHHRLAVGNAVERITLRAAAEGAAQSALWRLHSDLTGAGAAELPLNHVESSVLESVGNVRVSVAVTDVAARLNVNVASRTDLTRFLGTFTPAPAVAAGAIADWKDSDDTTAEGASEQVAYAVPGRPTLPRNRPFRTVEEVCEVTVITNEMCDDLLAHITVHGSGRINLNTATAPVLRSLPGFTANAVTQLLAARSTGRVYEDLYGFVMELPTQDRLSIQGVWTEVLDRVVARTTVVEVHVAAPGSANLQVRQHLVVDVSLAAPIVTRKAAE